MSENLLRSLTSDELRSVAEVADNVAECVRDAFTGTELTATGSLQIFTVDNATLLGRLELVDDQMVFIPESEYT